MPDVTTHDNTNSAGPQPQQEQQQQQDKQKQDQPPKARKVPALSLMEHGYKYDPRAGSFPGMSTFVPKPFDPLTIKDDATMVFFGKRRTGKSFMCRYILWLKQKVYPFVMVFTNTKFNMFWQDYIPDRFVHEGYNPEVLQRLILKQKIIVRKIMTGELQQTQRPVRDDQINPFKAVIFDDVISQGETFKRDKTIMSLFTEGRHYRVATFFCTQYAKGVSTVARGNCDLAFIFMQNQIIQMESIAQDFMGMLDKKTAIDVINRYAGGSDGFQCLVIDTSSKSRDPSEVIFTMTAEDPGVFRLGCRELWEGSPMDAAGAMNLYSKPAPTYNG